MRSPTPPTIARAWRILPALVACALAAACGGPSDERPPEVYRVRGLVRQLPSGPAGELHVRHEAIEGFKDADGEVVGMESMTMPFPLADPALAAGLAAGDKVEIVFEVRWHGGHPLQITALEKLPPETELAFEQVEEAEDGGSPSP